MGVWFRTGAWMTSGTNIYMPNDHLGYPPLWAFWCLLSHNIYTFLGNSLEVWRFVIKIPLILSHLALAYIVGRFAARNFGDSMGRRIFFIIIAWAFFVYIAAMWGQLNTLTALLTFLAFEAMVNQKTGKSAAFLGLAVTLKIYPLVVFPAFLVYAWMNKGVKEAAKLAALVTAIPIAFTAAVFAIYQWDILYFLKTIFYWTPVFETGQEQISGGCMNLWSFFGMFKIDVGTLWHLRVIWIPVLLVGFTVYYLRKRKWEVSDFNLAIIVLFSLFMMSYSWATEQLLIDVLPFMFLQLLCFRPQKSQFRHLLILQGLVFAFSAVNYGIFMFLPFFERFSPSTIPFLQLFTPIAGSPAWAIRGILGLAITGYLGFLLLKLIKNSQPTPKILQNNYCIKRLTFSLKQKNPPASKLSLSTFLRRRDSENELVEK